MLQRISERLAAMPLTVRRIEATEYVLQRIYDAAYLGLKGDSLAMAAGLLPAELSRLQQFDQLAEMAELKGRADSEVDTSRSLHEAAIGGDTKAALAILQHKHGWVAKKEVSIDVENRISITDALKAADARLIEALPAEALAMDEEDDDQDTALTLPAKFSQLESQPQD